MHRRSKVGLINAKAALLCDKLAEFGPDKEVESQVRHFWCGHLHDHSMYHSHLAISPRQHALMCLLYYALPNHMDPFVLQTTKWHSLSLGKY